MLQVYSSVFIGSLCQLDDAGSNLKLGMVHCMIHIVNLYFYTSYKSKPVNIRDVLISNDHIEANQRIIV